MFERMDIESALKSLSAPLAGEDGRVSGQEGGMATPIVRASQRAWCPNARGSSETTRPMPSSDCGNSCAVGKSAARDSVVRFPSETMSSISCATQTAWLSKSTVDSTRNARTRNGHAGWRARTSVSSGSGTTTCWATPKAFTPSLNAFWLKQTPPSPTLPRKGGGHSAQPHAARLGWKRKAIGSSGSGTKRSSRTLKACWTASRPRSSRLDAPSPRPSPPLGRGRAAAPFRIRTAHVRITGS